MVNPNFLNVLRKICKRLNKTDVNWVVTGSLGFALQGVLVEPNDIDLQTDNAGAYEIESLLSEFVVKNVTFSSTGPIRSHFGTLAINGIKVEIMGDVQKQLTDGTWEPVVDLVPDKRFVEVEGIQVPVLALEYEYQAYLRLGRTDRAELLKRWLEENPNH